MKKLLTLAVLLFSAAVVKAEPLCTDWGLGINLCAPMTSLDAAYGYNMSAPKGIPGNQGLLETTVAKIKDRLAVTFGGAKSVEEKASPYFSLTYGIKNPITDGQNILSTVRPGLYGGVKEVFDNSRREYFWGFKASTNIF